MFSLTDVRHHYEGRRALAIDAWHAEQGTHWLVMGPSGSGKSTLLNLLSGTLRSQAGKVVVAGQDFSGLSGAQLDRFRGQHIGLVLQRLHLVSSLSVEANLLLAQYCAGLPQDKQRVRSVLTELGLGDRGSDFPHQLSHGQAQRVAVARAVLNRPQLILADEPTSNLDDRNCEQALNLLVEQANRCEATLLIATHDSRLRERFVNRYALAGEE